MHLRLRTKTGSALLAAAAAAGLAASLLVGALPGTALASARHTRATSSRPVVTLARNASLGTILVDSGGRTLYTLTSGGRAVSCTGACATAWPPLVVPSATTHVSAGRGVSGIGVVSVDGRRQVTAHGQPLYRFVKDTGPGQANGNGLVAFGGVWMVVSAGSPAKAQAAPAHRSAPAPGAASTSTGGGSMGGGYGGGY